MYLLIYLFSFLNFWLHWVFAASLGLSLVTASGSNCLLRCTEVSLQGLLLLLSTGSSCEASVIMHAGSVAAAHGRWRLSSVVVMHGLSCSTTCGVFPDQGSNPHPPISRDIPIHSATSVALSLFLIVIRIKTFLSKLLRESYIMPNRYRKKKGFQVIKISLLKTKGL